MVITHRERVLKAIQHQEPDRVPLDMGGTFTSSISVGAYRGLAAHMNVPVSPRIVRKWANVVIPEESILRHLDIDTRMVAPRHDEFWNEYWRLWPGPETGSYVDEWGVTWARPENGPSFISRHPLAGEDVGVEDLEKYPWPDPGDPERFAGLQERAKALREGTDYAIVAIFPRPIVSLSQFMRGYQDWFLDMGMNQEFMGVLMEKILEVDLAIGKGILDRIGQYVDIVFVHDDLATQQSLMCSPDTYRKMIKPRHEKIFNLIKSHSDAKVVYHCDGAIVPIIGDFIEIGVDALNPVQVTASGMDTQGLKRAFGDKLSFWGAIDTHRVLPQGTADEVREEVKAQIEALGKQGGYILAAVHNIQDDVPPENIVAMFDAAKEHGVYR
jgi:uroporphyrinogen decarboxylase